MGNLSILNVGAGDTKLSFDKSNPAETIRAGRVIKDMLRRGFALLIEVERDGVKAYERAKDFDENTSEYIIADFDSAVAEKVDVQTESSKEEPANGESIQETKKPKNSGRKGRPLGAYKTSRVSSFGTSAVAVGRSAGG